MNWTTEYPSQPGYYWIRNYQLSQWDAFTVEPNIAEIHLSHAGDLLCYFSSVDDFFTDCDIVGGEWYGPIQPPE